MLRIKSLFNPSISKYYRTLGVLEITSGNSELGIDMIRKAYALDNNDILNLNNAAVYYALIEKDILRAYINFRAAYDGITKDTDEYVSSEIRSNYLKMEPVYLKYQQNLELMNSGITPEEIEIPPFNFIF